MEGKTKAKSRRRRTPTGAYAGRTKYDRWFDDMAASAEELSVVIQPPTPYPYKSSSPDDCKFRVRVVEVDRYAVRLEFTDHISEEDGAVWWVSKDSIRAAGIYVAQDFENLEEDDNE